jgi:hypothetical protein
MSLTGFLMLPLALPYQDKSPAEQTEALFGAPDHIIFRVAEVLRKSNPRFDMERFTKACKQGE